MDYQLCEYCGQRIADAVMPSHMARHAGKRIRRPKEAPKRGGRK